MRTEIESNFCDVVQYMYLRKQRPLGM